MAVFGGLQMQVEKTGVSVTIPNNPKAKLMYYLNSICTVLDVSEDDTAGIRRLRNYSNYASLSEEETDQLFLICVTISPDILLNKCIFQDDDMCGDSSNEFYKITAVQSRFAISRSILIAGRNHRVNNIMTFKMCWMRTNYFEPLESLKNYIEARNRQRRQQARQSSCSVM